MDSRELRPGKRAKCAALLLGFLLGCGGGGRSEPLDAGPMDGGGGSDGGTVCSADSNCDDGLFCNGAERCLPDDPGAGALGCVAPDDACLAGQSCDEGGRSCQTDCALNGDADGDGFDSVDCGGHDCDDAQSAINPDAAEVCDGNVDNDCNGLADSADGVCVPCGAGYTGFDDSCSNIDECAAGSPCGDAPGTTCVDTDGSYSCSCGEGYEEAATGGACTDVDECAAGDPCGAGGSECTNSIGSYTCTCITGFAPPASGGGTCEYLDPSLISLEPSEGALSPAFTGDVLSYELRLPAGLTSLTFTPSVSYPDHATIQIEGVDVASGATSLPVSVDFAPTPVAISVTTDSGATQTYTVVVSRAANNYLKASNTRAQSYFGSAIALSADGSTLAVGAFNEASSTTGIDGDQANNAAPGSGAVYVFTRAGGVWSQEAYIKASNTEQDDWFGWSIALSADGSTLAVGAQQEDSNATGIDGNQADNSMQKAGAVYVFSRAAGTWSQDAYLKASNTDAGDSFGVSVALSGDGATLAVSAYDEDSNATGVDGDELDNSARNAGAVYLFRLAGSTWSQEAYLKASNTDAGDSFGSSLALSQDGSTLAVGADFEASGATGVGAAQTDNSAMFAGAVYMFVRSGTTWSQQVYIKASNAEAPDEFGWVVALSADGSTLAVGAPSEDSSATGVGGSQADNSAIAAGAAYVFSRSGTTWSQRAYVKASNTEEFDSFGIAIALSADGSMLVVGSRDEGSNATGINGDQTNNSAVQAGAAYVFRRTSTSWSQEAYVKASNTDRLDQFGSAVGLSADGSTLVCGAYDDDSNATGVGGVQTDNSAGTSGAVYVY
ncbi:MAG: integrin [Deltaproteobacteria bacterium]|nr:integrin [Deltaproteobacteria bacterium]